MGGREYQRLSALPVQLIEIDNSVILKRGSTELRIKGEGSSQVIRQILWITATRKPTSQEICEFFSQPERSNISDLIQQLVERRILIPIEESATDCITNETHLDIFYWHFGESQQTVSKKLSDLGIVILGVNYISRQLIASLLTSGVTTIQVVDFPLLRNLRLFDEQGLPDFRNWNLGNFPPLDYNKWIDHLNPQSLSCIVATSDFGNHEGVRYWNEFCLESHCHFFPVVLQNTTGYVGPLIIPGETACLECLRARQNANFQDSLLTRAVENNAFEGQAVAGFHPAMASILGDIAALELTKFYSGALPGKNVGALIEVDLLATFMTVRRLLKNPRCQACSPFLSRSPLQIRKNVDSLPPANLK